MRLIRLRLRRLGLDLHRLFQLFWALLRFGIPLASALAVHRKCRARHLGVAVRQIVEELGLTYLKLGQYLASRHDLVPPEFRDEIEKVFENAPLLPAEVVRNVLYQELGAAFEAELSLFLDSPVAAASVAQVHRAQTIDGRWVAVKVQRPGIHDLFASDIRNLRLLASVADGLGISGTLPLGEVIDQVEAYTLREMDFITEGRTADRLRVNVTPHSVVPRIYWHLTTSKVLTMDFLEGPSLLDVIRMREKGDTARLASMVSHFDLDQVLSNLTYASLSQLFVTGFFHGDPHPGNIIVLQDNRVGFVDFGIFGELNDYQRELLANYTVSLALGDIGQCYRHIATIYFPTERSDEQSFAWDVQDTLRGWYHASASDHSSSKERHIGGAFDAMVRIVYRHRYRASLGYLLFWRAIIVLDSLAIRLQPSFDLAHQSRRFFERNRGDVFRLQTVGDDIPQVGSLLLNRMPFTSSSVCDATLRIERASGVRKRSSRRATAILSVRAE